jgi:dihydrofolate reductase
MPRKLISTTFVSLDGVMQAPGGPEEDPSGGFSLGGWTVPFFDEQVGEFMGRTMGVPFDLVLGRRTYEIFAAYWPNAPEEEAEGAKPLNDATKHVASRGEVDLSWAGSQRIEGDVAEGVAALKEQDGRELQVHGSGDLLQTLIRARLIDEYRVLVFPVVLGSGKRLFEPGATPAGLRLLESTTSGSGVVMSRYEQAGDPQTGTFA